MAYPEWQTKLQQHLDEVVGPNRIPAWTDIPQLPLVRAVVKEMIRYRSIAAELGIPHCLDEDDEFMGYQFKKGTSFHANYAYVGNYAVRSFIANTDFRVILTEPKMYPDTDRRKLLFNPERYLDPSYPTYKAPLTLYPNCHNYTPFGYGRRACRFSVSFCRHKLT